MSCGDEHHYEDELNRMHAGVLGHGCLGHGDREITDPEFIVPVPTLLSSMVGIRINSISAGIGFSAAVSVAGHVYTWGEGDIGQLGHGDKKSSLIPMQVRGLDRIRSVATTTNHCMAVTERGDVFSWGSNSDGQCGLGRSVVGENLFSPRLVEALAGVHVRSASAGNLHSLVVTEDGNVYSFGGGEDGALGHGTFDDRCDPTIVDALRHVRIVATAAQCHSIALTVDGAVFSWGCNNLGQLGLRQCGEDAALPQRVDALSGIDVCAVVAGMCASCAMTTTGELFTWGCGSHGVLGHGDESHQLAPKRVDALKDEWVVAVTFGISHTIAAVREGGVFGWGLVDGLGLPEAAATVPDNGDCILSPCRYQQLSCMP